MRILSSLRLIPILLLALTLSACDSSDGGNDDDGLSGGGTLSATVDGASFNATTIITTYQSGVLSIGANLGATQAGQQEQINLTVNGAAAGTFAFGIGGAVGVYSKAESITNIKAYTALSGSLTISEMDDNGAKGTFSFQGRDNDANTIQVSNGQFDVTF